MTSDEDNANHLNKYFSSVFTNEDDRSELIMNAAHEFIFDEKLPDPFTLNSPSNVPTIPEIIISETEVYEILKQLDPYKSHSDLCIHPRVLKELATELTYPITQIFQCSIDQGYVPAIWKHATVTPIHKGDDRHLAQNYRPISITSTLCRCLEKIIKNNIMEHLIKKNLLSDH